MKLIVGLGNPGSKYEKTRHNIGFMVIDEIIDNFKFPILNFKSIFNAKISKKQEVILAKPLAFMNNSGQAVKSLIRYWKLEIENLTVIHDDIDLPLGEIKVQQGRSSAGHKGVQSIIDALGTNNFIRVRIGIRPEENIDTPHQNKFGAGQTEKFVLQKFTSEEQKIINQTTKKAARIIKAALLT